MESRVSIIIPTYNHARFVGQAVQSALSQTYANTEVIVVDDGSTDNTRAVLADYKAHITYIHQQNRGLSAARNAGLAAAQGDFLVFLDADDLLRPDMLSYQYPLLASQPETGLVYSAFQLVSEDGLQVLQEIRPGKAGDVLEDMLCRTFFFPPGAALVRRHSLERIGLFDEAFPAAADTDLWLRIARAGYTFGYVDRPLFQYRVVAGSMSRNLAHQAQSELARLDKFFADATLPAAIKALEAEAYSLIYFEFAAKHYQRGDVGPAQDYLRAAITTCPARATDKEWLLEWLAGFALLSQPEDPRRLFEAVFNHLPPETVVLRSLRRRAYGRYHTAAAFSAYQNHCFRQIRPHILPALLNDPAIIRNRGFIRIALQAIFS